LLGLCGLRQKRFVALNDAEFIKVVKTKKYQFGFYLMTAREFKKFIHQVAVPLPKYKQDITVE